MRPLQRKINNKKSHNRNSPYLDEVDLVLGAQGLDQLGVCGLVAAGRQNAKESLCEEDHSVRTPEYDIHI